MEAHSNAPLRGGKFTNWEGGVRPAAFVHSPLLPRKSGGTWYNGSLSETDWMATFSALAGIQSPPGIDGIDIWPNLVDISSPPRRGEVHVWLSNVTWP